ncbi:hypothetical protein HGRIS_013007 [Hohenbuehelia grisea]|uniref:SAP domain-containing protein n=1 Tax=Hohenbuehelia grisea TaxID=104357 RepID=A0ABR3IUB4_9AGAR
MFQIIRFRASSLRPSARSYLTRSWENQSAAQLRQEAKHRGLSPKGNKASLILRIQEHEARSVASSPDPVSPRAVHASAAAAATHVPHAVDGEAPGIPATPESNKTASASSSGDYLKVILPDLSQPDPEPPVQIPYLPDLWESKKVTETAEAEETASEPVLPKLLVVAGSTHPGGGPSHNLLDTNASTLESSTPESSESSDASKPTQQKQGLLGDIAEDIGLPSFGSVKSGFSKFFS